MDSDELSDAIIQAVGRIVVEEPQAAGPELLTAVLDGIETWLQALSRQVCGATLERVPAARAAPRGEWPPCSLRHSTATRLYAETGDLEETARHLGHVKLETTRIYATWSDKRLRETLSRW